MHAGTLAAVALLVSAPLVSQAPVPGSQNDPRPAVRAVARSSAIVIDGRLDDAAWMAAEVAGDFRQQQPDEGAAPTERTEIRLLYDASAVYVGARMFDSAGPSGVRKLLVRRDQLLNDNASDKIAVVLDPYRDRQTSVWFELNPLGVKGDRLNSDASYDPVWEGASRVDSLGWTAEFKIPLSQLRFPRDSLQSWGLQVWRTLARRNESSMWAFWRRNEPGGPGYFGTVTGLALAAQPRRLELLPYLVQKGTFAEPPAGNPFRSRRELGTRAGGDLSYSLSSSFTLDATVNPDFGQVEVDPAVVNLSAFETTFQEKRPFFVANAGGFSFGGVSCYLCSNASGLNLFYTRRIGRAPQLAGLVQPGNYADFADAATILGAAKITGRTRGGLSVAVLEALTDGVTARYVPQATPTDEPASREIEPMTNYLVGRVRQDLRNGDTRIGFITTMTRRFMSDPALTSRLHHRAEAAGADIQHYWGGRGYSFTGQVAFSNVAGDSGALRRTQRTSAHYFQRPDRKATSDGLFDIRYDPARTSLRGYGVYARIAKESGNWRWETAQNWRSPGFEVNDLAALTRTDFRWMQASVLRSWTNPTRWYRGAALTVSAQQQLNYDGDRTDLQGGIAGEITFRNYVQARGLVITHPPTYDPYRTRGGVIVRSAGYHLFSTTVSGDTRKRVSWTVGGQGGPNISDDGGFVTGNASLVLKPAENIRISLGPSYLWDVDPRAFVTNIADSTAKQFGGVRSVFGRLEQHNLSMNARINATFTPNLTLELFAQPLLASGSYSDLNEYRAPRTTDALVYGRDVGTMSEVRDTTGRVTRYLVDPDGTGPAAGFEVANPNFNVRSLRGTAVVRWEYRPGSTLFFVWTQQRSGSDPFGDFDFSRERSALFRDRPVNVFQVKASYWIGR
ncbi:MAG TPA: DUF5916 domain-containing protein [Longimicrobium sp.]|jgi:hypothetical protein|uniref:DUF5916 domain-containing protein n=1 Tax=Longimicrobium sp. TaxID=2029185 RepID=UPI002ED96A92